MGITRREEQEVGFWKDMLGFDSCRGVVDRFAAVEIVLVLTKASAVTP